MGASMLIEDRWRWLCLLLLCGCWCQSVQGETAAGPLRVFLGITSRYEPTAANGRELVIEVAPDGPAARGGILPGDRILGFNGRLHSAPSLSTLLESLGWIEPGKPLQVDLLRQGLPLRLTIVPEPTVPGRQAALSSFLEECRKVGGCNQLCSPEDVRAPEISLQQLAAMHGEVALVFTKDPATGQPSLAASEPALPAGWQYQSDQTFQDGEVLKSIRGLLQNHSKVTVVYSQKEPGRFSLALKT
jgi:hypothetical protein